MKSIIIIAACLFIGCAKNDLTSLKQQLEGTWEIESSVGWPNSYSYPPGNGFIIVIGRNGVFERRQHDTIKYKGTFILKEKNDCYPRDSYNFFTTDDSYFGSSNYVTLDNGKLVFSTPNCYMDGGSNYFRKL